MYNSVNPDTSKYQLPDTSSCIVLLSVVAIVTAAIRELQQTALNDHAHHAYLDSSVVVVKFEATEAALYLKVPLGAPFWGFLVAKAFKMATKSLQHSLQFESNKGLSCPVNSLLSTVY